MLVGKIMMITGTSMLVMAFVNRRQEEFRKRLFKDLNSCGKYHADYLEDETHLPKNKHLILFGPAHSLTSQKLISPCFVPRSLESDRFWKFHLKESFAFKTASNQPILVRSGMNVYGFNLPPTQRELKDPKYEQRAIFDGIGVCVYGTVKNIEGKPTIIPEIIIGNKHESMLTYLDQLIVRTGKRGKFLLSVGTGLLAAHWAIHQFNKPKTEVEKEIEQFK